MPKGRLDSAAVTARLRRDIAEAADKAARGLVGHLRIKIGISARAGTPETERKRKQNAKAKRRRAAAKIWIPSRPGEPPRKRTGTLQKSIAHEITHEPRAVVVRVGSNVEYARHLEFGAPKNNLLPRPWLRPGAAEYAPTFGNILATELARRMRAGRRR